MVTPSQLRGGAILTLLAAQLFAVWDVGAPLIKAKVVALRYAGIETATIDWGSATTTTSRVPESVVVVEPSLKDDQVVFDHTINQSVFLIDASRPYVAGSVFESFRLPATCARVPQRIVNE